MIVNFAPVQDMIVMIVKQEVAEVSVVGVAEEEEVVEVKKVLGNLWTLVGPDDGLRMMVEGRGLLLHRVLVVGKSRQTNTIN
jgi:hypothetical protein